MKNIKSKQLTKNFNLSELVVSKDYPEIAKEIKLTKIDIVKFFYLCVFILQPLRDFLGVPIIVLSGKRNFRLNVLVKGFRNSLHLMLGLFDCAVDFTIQTKFSLNGKSELLWEAFHFLRRLHMIGELILYLTPTRKPKFIHISLPTQKDKNQVLIKYGKKFYKWEEWDAKFN